MPIKQIHLTCQQFTQNYCFSSQFITKQLHLWQMKEIKMTVLTQRNSFARKALLWVLMHIIWNHILHNKSSSLIQQHLNILCCCIWQRIIKMYFFSAKESLKMLHFTVIKCGEVSGSHFKAFDYCFKPFHINAGLMSILLV